MDQFLRLITLQDTNTRTVLIGSTALGVAAAVVGSFAVLRRRALVGDAVAHAALPGICAAYIVLGERNLGGFLLGAVAFGILAAAFVGFVKAQTRIKEDAAIGLAIGGFFGIGIVMSRMIQNRPDGNRAGLDSFIFGKAASMVSGDADLILVVSAVLLAVVVALHKELKLLCFDRDFAQAQGWPTTRIDLLLMALVCVCTVVGLPAVGVVLMVALLVIPPAAARFWTERLGTMLWIAAGIGGASGLLGTVLSATLPAPAGALTRGWPTGPLIVLVAACAFIVSLIAAPRRGLAAEAARRVTLRRRIAMQNLLRDAYERLEPRGAFDAAWQPGDLGRAGSRRPRLLRRAARAGLIGLAPNSSTATTPLTGGPRFSLTPAGQSAAAQVVRAHRLWELFLIEQADIAADHVDRDADQIEHVLPPELIATLESRLRETGRLPASGRSIVPRSPHEVGAQTQGGLR